MADLIVVDDDPPVRMLLLQVLARGGHELREAGSVAELRRQLALAPADLIVLDVTLPDGDGLALARELRARPDGPGVLLLSGLGEAVDRIAGLEAGADDYLVKPCEPAELLARVAMILRRRRPAEFASTSGAGLRLGPWWIDAEEHRARHADGRSLRLAPAELALLILFARHPGRVFSRDELLDLAPGRGDEPFDRSVDHRIARLRAKLGDDGRRQALIRAVRGRGYIHRP